MNCPYCDFHFKIFASYANLEELSKEAMIPAICERCANISLLFHGELMTLTLEQIEILKSSPAWETQLKPAHDIIITGPEYLNYKKWKQ